MSRVLIDAATSMQRWYRAVDWWERYVVPNSTMIGKCKHIFTQIIHILCDVIWWCHDFKQQVTLKWRMENWCRRRSRVYFKHRHPVTISRKNRTLLEERQGASIKERYVRWESARNLLVSKPANVNPITHPEILPQPQVFNWVITIVWK